MARAVPEKLIGRTVGGKFVIESTLGVGAMGAVYKARQLALDKAVAVKIMHRDLADDPQFLARFQREAKAASRLDHPCSIRVIDYGQEQDGLVYLAMEFIDGRDLLKVITEDWPLSPMRVVEILSQVLSALGKAHELGIIHRDLKPENIMVIREHDDDVGKPRDAVKVCDFGIAKVSDARAFQTSTSPGLQPLTTMGTLVGTPEYMSPEQGRGESLDPRSDLYSVGVVLFQMLTGTLPFTAENALGVVLKHVTDEPPVPSSINAMVMPALEAICLKALKKKREERFQTAREMRSQLRVAVGLEVPSHPKSSLDDTLPVGGPSPVANLPLANTEVNLQPASAGMPVAAQSDPRAYPTPRFERKETHTNTEVDIPLERSRTVPVLLALLAVFALGGLGAWIVTRMQHSPKAAAASGSASASGGVVDISPIEQSTLPPLATADPSQPARPVVAPRPTGKPTAGTSIPIASASAVVTATATASAAPAATPTVTASAIASAAPTATTTADPSFDPEHARVQIGMMNLSGVKEPALRGLLRNVGLTGCYRRALKAKGTRVGATPTLNLSIDHDGKIAAATVTGLNELPDAARCFQRELGGQQLPSGTFDSQGSSAEVWLTLSPE